MADAKISALPSLITPSTGDQIPIVNAGATKQITVGNLLPPSSTNILVAASNASEEFKSCADFQCTGSNDDVQIQAAINALPAGSNSSTGFYTGGGGRIQLSDGAFTLGAPLSWSNSNIVVAGVGGATLMTIPTSFNANFFNIGVTGSANTTWNTRFENFVVNGNTTNQTTGNIFNLTNTVNTYITGVTASQVFNYVLVLNKASGGDNYNNWVDKCVWGGNIGGFVNEVATETNVYMNSYFFGAVGYAGGAYPFNVGGGGCSIINNQIGGNSNANNQNAYIRCGNSNAIRVIGNNFNNTSKQAIQILSGGHQIIGNFFANVGALTPNTYNCIEVWDSGNIIVGNNFGRPSGSFGDVALHDVAEMNNSGGGNMISNNYANKGITTMNPGTVVLGNIGAIPTFDTGAGHTVDQLITQLQSMGIIKQ